MQTFNPSAECDRCGKRLTILSDGRSLYKHYSGTLICGGRAKAGTLRENKRVAAYRARRGGVNGL